MNDSATPSTGDSGSEIEALRAEVAELREQLTQFEARTNRLLDVVDGRSMMNAERVVQTHSSMQSMNERLKMAASQARRAFKAVNPQTPKKPAPNKPAPKNQTPAR